MLEDAFGTSRRFVGLENFHRLLNDPLYLDSFVTTGIFSILVAAGAMSAGLLLALAAQSVMRGRLLYRSLLIWPYAVAPAVAGILGSCHARLPHWASTGTTWSITSMQWSSS
jgi:sn-glycerol 3-phosphate transport system permease protein